MPGILALLAHPDDEFFCAGFLSAAASRGVPVHLAFWTRGEGSGSPARRFLFGCLPRAWHYRAAEARRAGKILGASSVTFLGAIDPAPANGLCAPSGETEEVVKKIERLWERLAPELLVTHGSDGEYGHPAHRRLHEIARNWAARTSERSLVSFAARGPGISPAQFLNRSDVADYVFDSEPFWRKKMEVVRVHRSQAGVLEALVDGRETSLRRLIRTSRLEGYHCWNEGAARAAVLEKLGHWTGPSV